MDIQFRDWNSKVNAMPRIPRSQEEGGYLLSLQEILQSINDNNSNKFPVQIKGSETANTIDEHCERLRPLGIVYQSHPQDKWHISEEMNDFFNTNNREFLLHFLNSKIKYITELLIFLEEPKTIGEIYNHAVNHYSMAWKGKSQIRDRLHWFIDLKAVNYSKYEKLYTLTDYGKQFIEKSSYISAHEIKSFHYDDTLNETEIILPDWLIEYIQSTKHKENEKKNSIGYIPGSSDNSINTILEVLDLAKDTIEYEEIFNYLHTTLNIKSSSVNGFLTLLTNLGMLVRRSEKIYETSNIGKDFLFSSNPDLEFLFILNNNYKYIFEMLKTIGESNKTNKELVAIGVTKYNMESENIEQIRKRIKFLKNAKLIMEDGVRSYTFTNRGQIFSDLCLTSISDEDSKKEKIPDEKNSDIYTLLHKLRMASIDSSNPRLFEKLIAEAFEQIGFISKLLAKSGTTDVLLTSPTAPKFMYKVAVEAKTNRDGKITEDKIDFETLKEHRKKHNADYSIVVGKQFKGTRLVDRAKSNNVLLLDLDILDILVKKHIAYPIQTNEYKILFSKPGLADISLLEQTYTSMERKKVLYQLIIEILMKNSDDEYTGGVLTAREIYIQIKNNDIFISQPLVPDEMENMLDLLSNPLIECIGSVKDGYYAKGSLKEAALKFGFYYNISSNEKIKFSEI